MSDTNRQTTKARALFEETFPDAAKPEPETADNTQTDDASSVQSVWEADELLDVIGEFDATDYEDTFQPIPPGKYAAEITEVSTRETKAGDGKYLAIAVQIVGGEHDGRFVWDRLNVVNQNPEAVAIARSRLANLCRSVGVRKPERYADFQGMAVTVIVGIEKSDEHGDSNKVKRYMATAGSEG
jgi:hypothetical protein